MYKVKSPVLFLVFNRPYETEQLFEAIRKAQPKKLYIAADGPRENGKDEISCSKVKNIVSNVDWECEVKTLYRDKNLGCKKAVSEGISWFFNNEEEGIVLEDDCLPNNDFFRFCDVMLDKYRDNDNIAHICGCNFQDNILRGDGDYYYSNLTHVWGWASWRLAWSRYDISMSDFENFKKEDSLKRVTDNSNVKRHLYNSLSLTHMGKINTWDYQYYYSNIKNNKISIIPNYNLISNIGFNKNGTHTFDPDNAVSNVKHQELPNQIKDPSKIFVDRIADNYTLVIEAPSRYVQNVNELKGFIKSTLRFVHILKNKS